MDTALTLAQLQLIANEIEAVTEPSEVLAVGLKLAGARGAIGTSGQLSGTTMIHLAHAKGISPRVFSIDTLRLFPETYAFFDSLEAQYGFKTEWHRPLENELATMLRNHGEFLFFDTKAKQEYCCDVRKVHVNERALESVDVWFTGLRKDQSNERNQTKKLSWLDARDKNGNHRKILKVAPLHCCTEEELRDYAAENMVPIHPLLAQTNEKGWRYESLGCHTCTTPIGPNEARRSGRWRWFNQLPAGAKKECGIHLSYSEDHATSDSQ